MTRQTLTCPRCRSRHALMLVQTDSGPEYPCVFCGHVEYPAGHLARARAIYAADRITRNYS